MQTIYLFDFDGTVTKGDTLLAIARQHKGSVHLWLWMLLHGPLLVLMKLGVCSNAAVKERFFRHFFGGMSILAFNRLCEQFAEKHVNMVRRSALKRISEANEQRARVLIVSASIDNWVMAMMQQFDVNIEVVGTQIEVVDGLLTGRFTTPNCYGEEKVNRIRALILDREQVKLIAFGDSRGDREMLDFADEAHYKELD